MMIRKVQKSYKQNVPLTFAPSSNPNIYIAKEKYDLADISSITKIPLARVKKNYSQGLFILTNAIAAYNLFNKYANEDFTEYFCKYNIEEEWEKVSKFFQYIPFIGIEEFAILHKYSPHILRNLKLKSRGDAIR